MRDTHLDVSTVSKKKLARADPPSSSDRLFRSLAAFRHWRLCARALSFSPRR
jgi:hypothetical protein